MNKVQNVAECVELCSLTADSEIDQLDLLIVGVVFFSFISYSNDICWHYS